MYLIGGEREREKERGAEKASEREREKGRRERERPKLLSVSYIMSLRWKHKVITHDNSQKPCREPI